MRAISLSTPIDDYFIVCPSPHLILISLSAPSQWWFHCPHLWWWFHYTPSLMMMISLSFPMIISLFLLFSSDDVIVFLITLQNFNRYLVLLSLLVSISDRLCSGNPEIAIKSIENLHGTIAPSFCLKVLGTLLICDNKDIRQAAGELSKCFSFHSISHSFFVFFLLLLNPFLFFFLYLSSYLCMFISFSISHWHFLSLLLTSFFYFSIFFPLFLSFRLSLCKQVHSFVSIFIQEKS